ncbi:helix-turn-helix DNA binding protein [Gordonia phage Mariokart]|nr:helix-turn-helix DNA binding protein [Gordonia phage Mariokart]
MSTATAQQTTTGSNPPVYTDGLGLTILAHRRYVGLSEQDFADAVGMSLHSYKRIESGRRPCPPGFLDTVFTVAAEFDRAADAVLDAWENNAAPGTRVTIAAGQSPLHRAALMRAVVIRTGTTPIIIGEENTDD